MTILSAISLKYVIGYAIALAAFCIFLVMAVIRN